MKNLYWIKRSWVYRNTFNKLNDNCFVTTEILKLTDSEAMLLSLEDDDYEEKFCHYAPEWLKQMWNDCPNMTVVFQGTEVTPFTERELMVLQGQPQLNFDLQDKWLVIYDDDDNVLLDYDYKYDGEILCFEGYEGTPTEIGDYAHFLGYYPVLNE